MNRHELRRTNPDHYVKNNPDLSHVVLSDLVRSLRITINPIVKFIDFLINDIGKTYLKQKIETLAGETLE